MPKLLVVATMVFCAVLVSACQAHRKLARHVLFADLKRNALPADNTVRVYVDANGDLYPDAQLPTDRELGKSGYSLVSYYADPANQARLGALCQQHGVAAPPATASPNEDAVAWEQLQLVLMQQKIKALNAALQQAGNKALLVVLIHGFNVQASDHSSPPTAQRAGSALYDSVRRVLVAAAPRQLADAVYVEVFWDGLQKDTPVGIWAAAQLNARYAGLCLRQLMAGTPVTTPIRVFTHSSGAIVATHTFWNVTSPYEKSTTKLIEEFDALYQACPTPTHPNVRLGLLVPATTGVAFAGYNSLAMDYNQRTPATIAPPMRHTIVGMNERDYALNKAGLSWPSKFGVTTLGCRAWDFQKTQQALGAAHLEAICFWDATRGKRTVWQPEKEGLRAKRYEAHGWLTYLSPERRQNFTEFVQKTIGN